MVAVPHSVLMPSGDKCTNFLSSVSSAGSSLGTGGMSTKIVAARLATSAGVTTVITRSSSPGNIASIVSYVQSLKNSTLGGKSGDIVSQSQTPEILTRSNSTLSLTGVTSSLMEPPLHTRFLPSHQPIRDRYFWLLHGLSPHGTIYIDAGAHRALAAKAGLLPAGIVDVDGSFAQQEAVRLVVVERPSSPDAKIVAGSGVEVGRALVNYSAMEITRIKGVRSSEIHGLLGYADSEYVALRENISFFERGSRSATPVLS